MYEDTYTRGGEIAEVTRDNVNAAIERDRREDDEDHAKSEHEEYKLAH